MADKKNMSIEDILAAARAADGEGGSSSPEASPSGEASAESPPAESAPAAQTKKPAEMSVEEMLAAARSEKSGAKKPAVPEKAAPEPAAAPAAKKDPKQMSMEEMLAAARSEKSETKEPATADKSSPEPAAAPAAKKDPKQMSVAEMLAAARGEKAAPAAKKPAAAKPKPAPKPAAKKEADSPATRTGPRDTASILAAARKGSKPGPMSKAEAAEKGKAVTAATGKKKIVAPPMPEKPAYATPRSTPPAEVEGRRGFFSSLVKVSLGSSLAVGFVSLAVTNLLWVLGLARFMFPNVRIEPPTRFKVGFPDDFAPGQVETKFKAQFGVWVVRYEYEGQPEIYALKTVCTHLGCTPNWLEGEQKFKCPCHGSGFYKDGVNFEGPAPRPLERYAIAIADDGQLEVDKSRKFNEELGQWNDPASYVSV